MSDTATVPSDTATATDTVPDTVPAVTLEAIVTFLGSADATTLDRVNAAIVKRAGKLARDKGGYLAGRYIPDPSRMIELATSEGPISLAPNGADKKAIAAAEKGTVAIHKAADALNKAIDAGARVEYVLGEAARETNAAARTASASREIVKVIDRATRRA